MQPNVGIGREDQPTIGVSSLKIEIDSIENSQKNSSIRARLENISYSRTGASFEGAGGRPPQGKRKKKEKKEKKEKKKKKKLKKEKRKKEGNY